MKFLMVIALAALASCQSKEVTEMSYSEVKALVAEKAQECVAQGVKPGTQEMQLCLRQEVNAEQARRHNRNARLQAAAASSTYCQAFGNTVQCF